MNANGKKMRRQFGLNRYQLHKESHAPKRKSKIFNQAKINKTR